MEESNNTDAQVCVEFDGMMFIVEVSSVGKELLSRSISISHHEKPPHLFDERRWTTPRYIKRHLPRALAREIDKGEPPQPHATPKMAWKPLNNCDSSLLTIPGKKKHHSCVWYEFPTANLSSCLILVVEEQTRCASGNNLQV